jgi:EAL and modified HD-GYP domain-containing signal transduction protein
MIVLDDFVLEGEYNPLVDLADIIKVDFLATTKEQRMNLIGDLVNKRVKFPGEKIETEEKFQEAIELGYDYFQGYFFCKPEIMKGRDIPGFKLNHLHILQEINRPDLDLKRIEDIIKMGVSLR